MAVLVAVDRGQEKREAAATRLQLAQVRATTAVLAIPAQKPIVAEAVALALLAALEPHHQMRAAMAAQEPHQQFLVGLLLTLAAAVVAQSMEPPELAAQVVVALVPLRPITQPTARLTPAAEAVAQETIPIQPA
jgi:hypothetical protein